MATFKSKLNFSFRRSPKLMTAAELEPGSAVEALSPVREIKLGNHTYLSGLDWRLLSEGGLRHSLEGFQGRKGVVYFLSQYGGLIGIAQLGSHQRQGRKYSIALQLAESVSRGSNEVFIFKFSDEPEIFGLFALIDSHPVPGFDALGSLNDIKDLLNHFHAVKQGQAIRYIGNTGLMEDEEHLSPSLLFDSPAGVARAKRVIDTAPIKLAVSVLLLLTAVGAGLGYWYVHEEEKRLLAVKNQVQDLNPAYDSLLSQALLVLGPSGNKRLDRWISFIGLLPTTHQGWRLQKLECKANECEAHWGREFGSYADFYASPLHGMSSSSEMLQSDEPSKASITTIHNIDPMDEPVQPGDLDELRPTIRVVSSLLQDLSLLPGMKAQLIEPQLFPKGAVGDPEILNRPVMQGGWVLEHDKASLIGLELSRSMYPESLHIELKGVEGRGTEIAYKLQGAYYGKAKAF